MSQDFERHLAEALAGLDQGQDIDAVLAGFPEEATALVPLLEVAAHARATLAFFEEPSTAGLAAGRRRMLETGARQRTAVRPPVWESTLAALGRWFRAPARGLAAAALLLALLVAAGGATVVAAANSLPGDPLYPVKRIREQVHLAVTTDPAARAALHGQFNHQRQTEAQAVAALGRHARIRFEGVLEQRTDGTWIVDGIALTVDPATVEGEPTPGSLLAIDVVSPGDGTLHVEHMTVHDRPHGRPGPTTTPGDSGPLKEPGRPTPAAAPATETAPAPTHQPTPPAEPTHGGPMMGQPSASPQPTHGRPGAGAGMGPPTASPGSGGGMGPGMGHATATPVAQQPAPTQASPTRPAATPMPEPSPTRHGSMMPHPTQGPHPTPTAGSGHPGGPGGPGRP